jgi:hypothetical protein
MNRFLKMGLAGITFIGLAAGSNQASAGIGNVIEGFQEVLGGKSSLSEGEISAGLKEALLIGTSHAVEKTGRGGGYLNNPEIRIPLPVQVAKSEKLLRFAGYGAQVDAFSESLNRAAENAAPLARDLFAQAIREMSIGDARRIWSGNDTAATDYFRRATGDRLQQTFTPVVHDSLAGVGATRQFQELDDSLKGLPFGESLAFDLDGYVTEGALKGLFMVLAEEERQIRRNPTARTTDLLRKVFGGTD